MAKWSVPVLAALGLADSAYLTALHLRDEIPPCLGYAGCQTVNTSAYAEILGVPTAAFGAALSALILAVAIYRVGAAGSGRLYLTLALYSLALAGVLFMAYLTGVELLVLHAVCYWCLAMAAFLVAMLALVVRDLLGFTGQPAT